MAGTTKTKQYYATFNAAEPNKPAFTATEPLKLLTSCYTMPDNADPREYIHAELSRRWLGRYLLYEIGECENGLTSDEVEAIHERIHGLKFDELIWMSRRLRVELTYRRAVRLGNLDRGIASGHSARLTSCCDHLHRPALYECPEAVERLGEVVSGGGKPQAEMRGRIEAISGSQQNSTLGGGLAERAVVFSAHQPGERRHATLPRNPAEYVTMVRHEALEQREIPSGDFLGLAEHDITFADCNFRKNFPGGRVAD